MKPILLCLLISTSLFHQSCDREAEPAAPPAVFEDIKVAKAGELVKNSNDGLVVLDVRTPGEFEGGHIEGAVLIDFMADDFADQIKKLDREKTYLLHCASGMRSGEALPLLKELGFKRVYHLAAGFKGWEEAGLPVAPR